MDRVEVPRGKMRGHLAGYILKGTRSAAPLSVIYSSAGCWVKTRRTMEPRGEERHDGRCAVYGGIYQTTSTRRQATRRSVVVGAGENGYTTLHQAYTRIIYRRVRETPAACGVRG
ncbi:hypothetical protein U1Q18_049382 [Sarracenia purpurea var. burkii]